MKTETTIQGLHAALGAARTARKAIGFVPTMGNLHEGHLRLVQEARNRCDIVVVSIFVNPTQFGQGEDFERYPRTLEEDSKLLFDADCDILFAPTVSQMYGDSPQQTTVQVNSIADDLCGRSRVGHFTGVATVVTKLFNIVQPNVAFFGEKDYQQVAVIRHLTRDLCFPLDVIGVPTVRAADGVALSSRNGYLTPTQRATAPVIYQTMQAIAQRLQAGETDYALLMQQGTQQLQAAGLLVDYVEIRNPMLAQPTPQSTEWVVLVAAKLGNTRLIDNLTVQQAKLSS
ncbi:MAG: pantoate--beta-alanine ligase [Pseudomonadota bacterium]|nr:pantoate--beta-alanine ligase [Pseudomonadota bacterium]